MNQYVLTVQEALRAHATPKKAEASAWFFKTGPGQYGEGDQFIGVTLPEQRVIAKANRDAKLATVVELLQSPIHEDRMTALLIWTYQFKVADDYTKKMIFEAYVANTVRINNWDLVDSSASQLVGVWLGESCNWTVPDGGFKLLTELAKSDSLWDRRISIIAAAAFIGHGISDETYRLADVLMYDKQDLMHKAIGWMLRETGKRVSAVGLRDYLKTRYQTMPRTMLRYAIEKFDAEERQRYLKGLV